MSQARFQKRQREKAQREKAEAKRQRRAERSNATASGTDDDGDGADRPQDEVLAELAALHARFDDGGMSFDEFEERKQELIEQLSV